MGLADLGGLIGQGRACPSITAQKPIASIKLDPIEMPSRDLDFSIMGT
jgi:hypothetical protein